MSANPRVVHVITRLLRGGTEENTVLCCKAQQAAGYEVSLAHGKSSADAFWSEQAAGIALVVVPSLVHPISLSADFRALLELVRTFRRIKPDVVHTHQSKAGILGRLAGRFAGAKVVVHTVHIIPFTNVSRGQRLIYVLSERLAARFCDAMVFVSKGAMSEYARNGIGKNVPAMVIPSGMDITRFQRHSGELRSADARRLAAAHADKLKILYLSSFEERKRHRELLAAFADRHASMTGIHIIFAGEGSTKCEIAERIAALGLHDEVSILDHCETPEDLIAISDLCLYASEREGLPRAAIQYLASGKPVVVSELPGIEEIVDHNVNGLVVPANDLGGLAKAVLGLRDDRQQLERLGAGAQRTDTSRWHADVMTTEVDALYRRLLAAKSSRASR
jgi:glycosyltransferase involved in cell wall biosynthesis